MLHKYLVIKVRLEIDKIKLSNPNNHSVKKEGQILTSNVV